MMKNHISSFNYIAKVEKENIRKTQVAMKKEIKLYKDSFNLLAKVLDELFPHPMQKAKSITDIAVLPITSKIVMSLKSYFNLAMMGYYHDATNFYRNILESVLLCMLVAEKPQYTVKWLKGKIEPREVRRALGLESIADVYRMMSDYVHLNVHSIGTFVEIRMKEQRGLMIAGWIPQFNEDNARILLIPVLGPMLISYLSDSYRNRLSSNLLRKISRYTKRIEKTWKSFVLVSQP